jgi:hypothetical protein
LPHGWQEIAAQELRKNLGIDLIRLDLGFDDRLDLKRIAREDRGHEGPQDLDHRPCVGGRFQGDRHETTRKQTTPRIAASRTRSS